MTTKEIFLKKIKYLNKPFLWALFGASMVVALYFGVWKSPFIDGSMMFAGFSGMFVGYFIAGLAFIWYKILDKKYK